MMTSTPSTRATLIAAHATAADGDDLYQEALLRAIPLAFAAGAVVGRACARDTACLLRALACTRVLAIAGGLVVLTLVAGALCDFGVQDISVPSSVPPASLQRGLSLLSVLSIIAFTASFTLRRRQREQARLAA